MSDRDPPLAAGIPPEHLAALSHEFRTPLNGGAGDEPRLLDGTRLTAEQRAYVAALRESGEHLLGLVNDVLDYAKLGAGRVDLNPGVVEVEDLLRSVCELMSPRAHEKGVEIGWAADAGLGAIRADEGRLKQILLNLAGNAVKFVETGGVLVLAEAAGPGRIRFTVSDTGPGVPEAAQRPHLRSLRPGRSGRGRRGWRASAGLGLAIARRLGDAMDGASGGREQRGPRGRLHRFEAPFERTPLRRLRAPGRWPTARSPSPRPAPSSARPRRDRSRPGAGARSRRPGSRRP